MLSNNYTDKYKIVIVVTAMKKCLGNIVKLVRI